MRVEENLFRDAFEMLEHRCDKCIEIKGDYVKK